MGINAEKVVGGKEQQGLQVQMIKRFTRQSKLGPVKMKLWH